MYTSCTCRCIMPLRMSAASPAAVSLEKHVVDSDSAAIASVEVVMYICICVCVCVYVCMYVCMSVCLSVSVCLPPRKYPDSVEGSLIENFQDSTLSQANSG